MHSPEICQSVSHLVAVIPWFGGPMTVITPLLSLTIQSTCVSNFTDDFKLDLIKQITERSYSVADVSRRLGVSTHTLCSWMKCHSVCSKSAT
ncbi:transposase [Paraburkholderia aspalathi]|nr:transposase [Paraburkholderia aspalathi]